MYVRESLAMRTTISVDIIMWAFVSHFPGKILRSCCCLKIPNRDEFCTSRKLRTRSMPHIFLLLFSFRGTLLSSCLSHGCGWPLKREMNAWLHLHAAYSYTISEARWLEAIKLSCCFENMISTLLGCCFKLSKRFSNSPFVYVWACLCRITNF